MAYLDHSRTATPGASALVRVLRALDDFTASYRRWSAARRRDELVYRLSDRELQDIGLTRTPRLEPRYSPYSARV